MFTTRVFRLALPLLAACFAALCLLLPARTAHADAVVGGGNSDDCTSAALTVALAQGGLITFNCGAAPHTIILTATQSINTSLILDGEGKITLSGGGARRLFLVGGGVDVTLRNLTISNGYNNFTDGGAIVNAGRLTIEDSTLQNNVNTSNFSGGAIYTTNRLTVTRSSFINNTGGNAGAIHPRWSDARTVIQDSTFINNRTTNTSGSGWGGAILVWDGAQVTISNTQFISNTARAGGAIYVFGAASHLNIGGGQFISNTATSTFSSFGGAVFNQGVLTQTASLLRANRSQLWGGAIFNEFYGAARLVGNTFIANSAQLGGAIYNEAYGTALSLAGGLLEGNMAVEAGGVYNHGRMSIEGATLSGNATLALLSGNSSHTIISGTTIVGNANGLRPGGWLTMTNSTISGNSGDGMNVDLTYARLVNVTIAHNSNYGLVKTGSYAANLNLVNTLLAGNGGGNCAAVSGPLTFNSQFGLSSDGSCGWTGAGNQANANAGLRPLGHYGGATQTHMLMPDSDALNTGTISGCPGTDQRGMDRPVGASCDIGAAEATDSDLLHRVFLPFVRR